MARTPYQDPKAEEEYQNILNQSSRPYVEEDRPSFNNEGNMMLRDRAVGAHNAKLKKNQ